MLQNSVEVKKLVALERRIPFCLQSLDLQVSDVEWFHQSQVSNQALKLIPCTDSLYRLLFCTGHFFCVQAVQGTLLYRL